MNFLKKIYQTTAKTIKRISFAFIGSSIVIFIIMDVFNFFGNKKSVIGSFKYGEIFGTMFLIVGFIIGLNLIAQAIGYEKVGIFLKKYIKKEKMEKK